MTVPSVARGEGLVVQVVAISARGRRSKPVQARLNGTLRLGRAAPAKKAAPKKSRRKARPRR